jgi:hypothetical protein
VRTIIERLKKWVREGLDVIGSSSGWNGLVFV